MKLGAPTRTKLYDTRAAVDPVSRPLDEEVEGQKRIQPGKFRFYIISMHSGLRRFIQRTEMQFQEQSDVSALEINCKPLITSTITLLLFHQQPQLCITTI